MKITPEQWPTLSRLFDEVLEVPGEDRDTWIESLEDVPQELKVQLRSLLEHHARIETSDFLNTLPKMEFADAAASLASPALLPGAIVGPYVLEQEIGRGGMAVVWRAHRSDGLLKRPVALKLLYSGCYSDELLARFAQERDILAGIAHPHIARLYDAGFTQTGQPFLALEFVEGLTLTMFCRQHALEVPQRLRLILQVLGAVQYAHSHLVVHRDLKPSNILVTAQGEVRLLDFGIAKLLADEPGTAPHITQFGGRALTPDYASPEQIRGQALSTATDIYSLGVILYELLTDALPFRPKGNAPGAAEEAILAGVPQKPSRAPGLSRPQVRQLRGDLDTITLKALKLDPADRYATADAFAQDIRRYLDGEAVLAQPDSTWYRTRKFLRRNRVASAAGAAALLAVGVGLTVSLWQANAARRAAARSDLEARKSRAVQAFLFQTLSHLAASENGTLSGTRAEIGRLLEQKKKEILTRYREQPLVMAELLGVIGNLWYYLNDPDKSVQALNEQLATLKTTGPDLSGEARVLLGIANTLTLKNEESPREAILRKGLDLLADDSSRQGILLRGEFLGDLGRSLFEQGRYDDASEILDKGRRLLEPHFQDTVAYGVVLQSMAMVSSAHQDNAHTVSYLEQALHAIRADPNTDTELETLAVLHDLGTAYSLVGRFQDAERALSEAVTLQRNAYGGSDLPYSAMLSELANVRERAGKYDEALNNLGDAIRVSMASNADGAKIILLGNRTDLGYALLDAGDIAQVGRLVPELLASIDDNAAARRPDYQIRGYGVVVRYREAIGDYSEARRYIDQEMKVLNERLGGSPPFKSRLQLQIGRVALEAGDYAAARTELQKVMGLSSPNELILGSAANMARRLLAAAQLETGMPADALPVFQKQLQEFNAQQKQQRTPREEADLRLLYGRALVAVGRAGEGRSELQRAHQLLQTQYRDSPWLADAKIRLAECLLALGDSAAARPLIENAASIQAAHPKLGEHFRRPLRSAQAKLGAVH